MSIRGIDTQIMITRAADVVKDTSILQKHPQITQENLAERGKLESNQDQARVLAAEHAEMEGIRTDVEGGGSGAAGGGGPGGEEEEEQEQEQQKELLVAPADHEQIIDIMV